MKNIKNINLLEFVILLMPIIDILNTITHMSLSLYFRGLFLVVIVLYFLFKVKSKYKNISFILLTLIGVFSIIYLGHYYTINGTYNLVNEITSLIKFIYLPVSSIILVNIYEEKQFDLPKTMLRLTIIYIILTLIPTILGIALPSYDYGKLGYSGLFYSPNELGSILAILSPFSILALQQDNHKISNLIISIFFIITCFILGTKAPIIGLMISLLGVTFITICRIFNHKKNYRNLIINIFLILFTIFIYENSYLKYNINYQGEEFTTKEQEKAQNKEGININEDYLNFPIHNYGEEYKDNKIINLIFSSRDVFLNSNLAKYKHAPITNKIYGLSLGLNQNNNGEDNMSELDFLDIFIYYGLIGFIILGTYLIYLLVLMIIKFFQNFKKNIQNNELCAMCLSFGIALSLALTAGHTLSAPAVSTILLIPIVYLITKFKVISKIPKINIKILSIGLSCFILLSTLLIINDYHQTYNLEITLDDNLTFSDEVLKLEVEKVKYQDTTDILTYYVPKKYHNLAIIHVKRTCQDITTNFFTILNNEGITAHITLNISDDYTSKTLNKNSLSLKGDTNLLIANTYHYTLSSDTLTSFNKYAVKNLIKEESDYLTNTSLITKKISLKPFTSIDTYIINSKDNLITTNDELNWVAFNGSYEANLNNLYTRNYATLTLKYGPEFNDYLTNNYLFTLAKYTNVENNIYYQEYELNNTSNIHYTIFNNAYLNYQIYNTLTSNKIKNNLLTNYVNTIKKEYEEKNYIKTSSGIIFNNFLDSTFDNQIVVLNFLTEYNKTNKDKEITNIINALLGELNNPQWLTKNSIHEYLNYEKEYVGTLLDPSITLNNLTILNNNLLKLNIDNQKIEEYLKILN